MCAMFHCCWYLLWFNYCVARKKIAYCNSNWALVGTQCSVITAHSYWGAIQWSFPICGKPACMSKLLTDYNITLKTSFGVLLVLRLLALVQLHFIASSGISTSEFPTPCPKRPCYTLSQVMDNLSKFQYNSGVYSRISWSSQWRSVSHSGPCWGCFCVKEKGGDRR